MVMSYLMKKKTSKWWRDSLTHPA